MTTLLYARFLPQRWMTPDARDDIAPQNYLRKDASAPTFFCPSPGCGFAAEKARDQVSALGHSHHHTWAQPPYPCSCVIRHLHFVYNSVHSCARLRSSCCQRLLPCRGQSSERLPRSPRQNWLKTERWENSFPHSSSAEKATLRAALACSRQPGGRSWRCEGGWAVNAVDAIRCRSVLNALRASKPSASSAMASGTAKILVRKPRKRKT